MFSRSALIIVGFAVAEYFVSARVIGAVGFGTAILAWVVLAIVGYSLLRSTWRQTLTELRADTAQEQLSATAVRTVAALGLIVPGFLSAAIGALLFVPPIGSIARRTLQSRTPEWVRSGPAAGFDVFGGSRRFDRDVVDVDLVDEAERRDSPTTPDHPNDARSAQPELG